MPELRDSQHWATKETFEQGSRECSDWRPFLQPPRVTCDMAETEPLLDPVASYSTRNDPEAHDSPAEQLDNASTLTRWRAKTARTLESHRLHQTVIALVSTLLLSLILEYLAFIFSLQIVIDATCVLADLTYTILSPT